ncbi:MAG: hypothetical protein A3C79_02505 [Candidatus Taylorbacteria bacterium RIFCSPHIGHO2_02_FULL_45_28]|nr:MAG: hypothetical protein A2830_03310 [Candidatus Taylorbacteria bacterium RIFCSPHIGHO2_01_FULL_44_110]OHA25324.1 MAG: hypothetical protein A3C79_02505 [Candidatus Taylorbacteria bacterium RIFCSPHIGHO2_02_FULL_45_28]OHA32985.1 MAG: hypothetical protein A3A23_01150 [Candidatus Taylorbacteria bacterium RIFCSPLOWO2_01_FULL_45_59]
MNIRKKVVIVFVVSFLASILAGVFIFVALMQTKENILELGLTSNIRAEIFHQANLVDEYLLHRDENSHAQWILTSQTIDELFEKVGKYLNESAEAELLVLLKKDNDITKQISGQLFKDFPTHPEMLESRELEAQLVSRLLITRTEMTEKAERLEVIVGGEIFATQERLSIGIGALTILLFVIVMINLTWVRTVVEELEEMVAKEKAMLESIADGMVAVDDAGRIIAMSRVAEKMLGKRFDEIKGRSLHETIPVVDDHGKAIPKEKRPIYITLATAGMSTMVAFFTRNDGTNFPVVITSAAVILDGKVIGAIDNFHDVTKEREIDHAKSEFVSLASHQLRTPSTSMKWFLEMLLSGDAGPLNEKQRGYFNEIYLNNQRIISLVNALLDISRIELGVFVVNPELTEMTAFTKDILEEFKTQIQEKKIIIKESFAPDLRPLMIDPKLLRIAIQNIVSNAVKYTPENGVVSIDISLVREGESVGNRELKTKNLLVRVTDTGYGIPKAQYGMIFTKLFRADNVKDKDTDGTGLGLYLTKSIIEHAKGDIWFESELNKGTTFYLAIPIS